MKKIKLNEFVSVICIEITMIFHIKDYQMNENDSDCFFFGSFSSYRIEYITVVSMETIKVQ